MELTADLLRAAAKHLELGRSDLADQTLFAHLDVPVGDAAVSHLLGLAYMRIGDFRAAATWFGDAVAAEPESSEHHNDIGVALFQMGRLWRARAAFERAAALSPDFFNAKDNLAQLDQRIACGASLLQDGTRAFERGDFEPARSLARQCLQEIPDQPDALCLLGSIAHVQDDRAGALDMVERALAEHPDYADALDLLDRASAGAATPVIALPAWRLRPPRVAQAKPLVSLTIGTFNHARYVETAVNSALAQTYSPLEIIISDDASTDETANVIEACIARYQGPHRLQFIRQPRNLGNRGRNNWVDVYRRTTGRFIVQFAGDDVMHADMVERMVELWRTRGVSLVAVNAHCIDGASRSLGRTLRDPLAPPNDSLESLARDGVNHCVFGAGMGCDRELYETFPFSPNTPARVLGTIDIMFPFHAGLLNGCASIPMPLMQYRMHGAQTSLVVAHEQAHDALTQLVVEERIWEGHLAHALFMKETLAKLAQLSPERFSGTLQALEPALANQTFIMAQRQVEARHRLFYQHGIWDVGGGK